MIKVVRKKKLGKKEKKNTKEKKMQKGEKNIQDEGSDDQGTKKGKLYN